MQNDPSILYPMFALVAWTFLMAMVMLRRAFRAVGEGLDREYFRYGAGEAPGYLRAGYQHYANLFEMPVLFYAAVITLHVTGVTTGVLLGAAWVYVGLRVVHSVLHLANRNVPRRRDAFLLSVAVLAVLWVGLIVGVARA